MMSSARGPFGELSSLDLMAAHYTTTLPGAPDEEYVVLHFQSAFGNKMKAVGTVTPIVDSGVWTASGNYIR